MLYTVYTDNDNYVLWIGNTYNDSVELDIEDIDMEYLNAYQLIDGQLIFDESRVQVIDARRQKEANQEEIFALNQKLKDSQDIISEMMEEIMALNNPLTFVADVLKIFVSYSAKYKTQLADRKAWRTRIKELQGIS